MVERVKLGRSFFMVETGSLMLVNAILEISRVPDRKKRTAGILRY